MAANAAAWLPSAKAHPYQIKDSPMPTPNADQVVVRVRAVAINPADYVVQSLGIVYETYPVIPGSDAAGEIVHVGSAVKAFQVGDRVAFFLAKGAFQLYVAVTPPWVVRIPDDIHFTQACVLPLALAVSTVCLFENDMLMLERPQAQHASPNGKLLLVWGGSSALGSCAIQQARAAGYEVAAVAGRHNFDYCQTLGAQHVFDYKDADVVQNVTEALRGKYCAGAFCSIVGQGAIGQCAQIVDRLEGNKFVSVVLPPPLAIPDPVPEGVRFGQSWSRELDTSEACKDVFGAWLPEALASRTMKCRPEPEIIGQGLEKIQEAVDKMGQGVSARKLVVEL